MNGFEQCMDESYCDSNTTHVYRRDNVHVQITKSARTKLLIQSILHHPRYCDVLYKFAKEDRKFIWSMMYALLDSVKQKKA